MLFVTISSGMAYGAAISYGLTPLLAAMLGGNAFAGERADRSAELLAYLPVSKSRRLLSKLIFAVLVTALISAINVAAIRVYLGQFPWQISEGDDLLSGLKYSSITALAMFGAGWGFSSFFSSPTLATCGAIGVPFLILAGLLIAETMDMIRVEQVTGTYLALSLALGVGGFAAGTWRFLTRSEP
jgi:ABC-type transport system involved in multi-copper enzyme maturation permease subunit